MVARSVDNLGILFSDQGRLDEAAQQFRRALLIREKGLPPRHPELAIGLTNLGIVRRAQARWAEAESLLQRALSIREAALPVNDPCIPLSLYNLAMVYIDQNQPLQAEPLFKRALAIREMTLPPQHSDLATSLNNLANVYRDTGRFAEAEAALSAGVVDSRAYVYHTTRMVRVVENYARLLQMTDRSVQANELVARVRPPLRQDVLPAAFKP